MKFAHLADCHVGAWRDPKLRALSVQAFEVAIDTCIKENVELVLIAGDLFHTAIPSLDGVKAVFKALKLLKNQGIPVYFIAGSHDYSPTGKTMLDIIEEAGLGTNVFRGAVEDGLLKLRWTHDKQSNVKLTGILGRANQLDSAIYASLDHASVSNEPGDKIFMFHTSLEELKPSGMIIDSAPLSMLPFGCRYYAGGHVHTRFNEVVQERHIVYPGPLWPASFSELEELGGGSFCIVENWKVREIMLELKPIISLKVDISNLAPANVPSAILEAVDNVKDAIVLVRVSGMIAGKPSDVPWRVISEEFERRGAYSVLRNTAAVTNPSLETNFISGSLEDIEKKVIAEHDIDAELAMQLMSALGAQQAEGEKKAAYEERVLGAASTTVKVWSAHRR